MKLSVYKKSQVLFKLCFGFVLFLIAVKTGTLFSRAAWLWFCHGSSLLCVTNELYTTTRQSGLSDYAELVLVPNKPPGVKVMMAGSCMTIPTVDWVARLPSFSCWSPHLRCDGIGRQNLWEIIGVRRGHEDRTLVWWDWCPYKKRHQRACSPAPCSCKEKRPCEPWGRRQLSTSQNESLYQNLTELAPWSQTSSFQSREKINFCWLSHSVCGILSWQPEEANISPKSASRELTYNVDLWKYCQIDHCDREKSDQPWLHTTVAWKVFQNTDYWILYILI